MLTCACGRHACTPPGKVHHWGPWVNFSEPSLTEQRTHFGLWTVLSSPLTLSLDFTNKSAVDSVWDVITNTHAIAVNQAWGGSQGTVFAAAPDTVVLGAANSLDETWDDAGRWRGTRQSRYQVAVPRWQAWYKPLPGGGCALFVANHGDTPANISFRLADVPGLGPPPAPPHCPASQFPRHLGDVECFGLEAARAVDGRPVLTPSDCCAACAAAGSACETWQFCAEGKACAEHTPGCYVGNMTSCAKSSDGWDSFARDGPAPPPSPLPPPPSPPGPLPPGYPKKFTVTDVWQRAVVATGATGYSVTSLASHDSAYVTLAPE